MNNSYEIDKLRVQQFGLTATIKDDRGKGHYFYRGHEYIEICGIKWAVTNVGANTEIDSGLYFAFGEKQGYTAEQVCSSERRFIRNEYTDVEFDTVNVYWGGNWRLPTVDEFNSLIFSATNEWVKNYQGSGVNGRLFTDKTDSSKKLFFPSAGCCINSSLFYAGSVGRYWSSSLLSYSVDTGKSLYFSYWCSSMDFNDRCIGLSIRGVIGD